MIRQEDRAPLQRPDTSRPSWRLIAEAGALMLIASMAIRLLPFARLARKIEGGGRMIPATVDQIATLVRAVSAWSRRLPWRTKCFEEGLTAHWLLQRRGLASTLHYGAATIDGELQAHVWVRSGETDVIGCENAADYALLARFPDH